MYTCVFSCSLPPAFVCAAAVTGGWYGYQNKSAQKVDPGEDNSPAAPARIWTCDLSAESRCQSSLVLVPLSYPCSNEQNWVGQAKLFGYITLNITVQHMHTVFILTLTRECHLSVSFTVLKTALHDLLAGPLCSERFIYIYMSMCQKVLLRRWTLEWKIKAEKSFSK